MPNKVLERVPFNLIAALLALVSAYLGWWALSFEAPLWGFASVAALMAAIGLFRRQRWAQLAWYALAFSASIGWLWSVVSVVGPSWPYPSVGASFISLMPGALLLLLCGCGSFLVAREYRRIGSKPPA